MPQLHVKVAILQDVHVDFAPGLPSYARGNRYDVPADTAELLVAGGAAEPVEVPEQSYLDADGERQLATDDERAELLERLQALVPPPPQPPEEKKPAAPAKE